MIHPTVDIHTYLKPGVRVHLAWARRRVHVADGHVDAQ